VDDWPGPRPTVDDETRPFWEALERHRVLLQRCHDCGEIQHYYRAFCATCWSTSVADLEAVGEGRIWACSTICRNRSPEWAARVPYTVAVVELAEGVKVLARLDVPAGDEQPAIGTRVQATFTEGETGPTQLRFAPIPHGLDKQ
jgi:uncharacterized OB-fold protein